MNRVAFWIQAAALAVSSAACSSDEAGSPHPAEDAGAQKPSEIDCAAVNPVPTFRDLQGGILPICHQCHSAQVSGTARHDAPEGLNFDTYEQLKANAETASFLVKARVMPFPDGVGPTEEQRADLFAWAACGTPP